MGRGRLLPRSSPGPSSRGLWRPLLRCLQLLQPVRQVSVSRGKARDDVLVPLGLDAPAVQLTLEEADTISQFLDQRFMVYL